jgi:uncharacterized protein YuzE
MQESYLEITYRKGRALAAYYYLPRREGQKSYRTREHAPGLLVDYSRGGKPIGIEIAAPSRVSLRALNRVLGELGQEKLGKEEFAPLEVRASA